MGMSISRAVNMFRYMFKYKNMKIDMDMGKDIGRRHGHAA
jgi:hypothetical protein